MSNPNDLQALLASIRSRPSPSTTPAQDAHPSQYPQQYQQHPGLRQQPYDGQSFSHPQMHQHAYHHPSVSSAPYSPSPYANTPPHHGSDIISPNVPTPQPLQLAGNPDRAADLLSLLRFRHAAPSPHQYQAPAMGIPHPMSPRVQETGPQQPPRAHARNISASDLVASIMGVPGTAPAAPPVNLPTASQVRQPEPAIAAESPSAAVPSAENTQEFLLRLLNRPKPSPEPVPQPAKSPVILSPQFDAAPVEEKVAFGPVDEKDSIKADVSSSQVPKSSSVTPKETIFTYVNPFEQLAAASPRNRTPQPKSRSESPAIELPKRTKVNIAAKVEPTVMPEAAETAGTADWATANSQEQIAEEQGEAVSEVVNQLVDQIGREVDDAVDKAIEEEAETMAANQEEASEAVLSSVVDQLQETAAEVKKELSDGERKETVQDATAAAAAAAEATATAAEVAKEAANDSADALADSWESAEDSAEKEEERVVRVYNFPLKPFISITVKAHAGKLATLRDDGIMDIARLKKEFDQLDRSLTSATAEYIVYALAKSGGMRIIRQDDGSDKQVFRSNRDRIFNVALCTSQTTSGVSKEQALLGIGVSGTVYWAMISRGDQDFFEMDALESESLVFPPFPASDENTSGGQLKTRAKRSSRHPEFFAIGRGKNIYVISPQAAMNPSFGVSGSQRNVNTEKFFKERALKISTGKAGKDFVFSDDDTVIASLDKTGRLRFWDTRDVVNNPDFFVNGSSPAEIRVPLNTFVTGSPTEKSWPTSVLFIDKLRPYVKSMALRYVLVGLKQNHTLQLWDIGLGKAVQELKFPHENESDAICSVAYHPSSGIIVVGHPTRNSIYFVHLSAPRYNLQPMSQASFVKRAGEKDSSLPKPESTACMSGIREISFASKGQLRSLEILPIKRGLEEENGMFELYVMHSRGVTCLNIRKEDLGWSSDNKIIRPVNALEEGFIEIADLQTFPSYVADEPSVNGDAAPTPQKVTPKETLKKTSEVESNVGAVPLRTQSPTKPAPKKKPVEEAVDSTVTNGAEKPEKKKKKKGPAGESVVKVKETHVNTTTVTPSGEVPSDTCIPPPPTKTTKEVTPEQLNGNDISTSSATMHPLPPAASSRFPNFTAPTTLGGSGDIWNKHLEDLQTSVSNEFSKSLGREFEGLYRRFDDERRAWDAASAAKQDQVLRLVSSTLSDNVEKNLARIVSNSIQSQVLPAITNAVSAAIGKQLDDVVARQLGGTISNELRQALPGAVNHAVQQPDMMESVSDMVAQKLATHVESEFSRAMHSTITPAFKNLALRAAEKIGTDMETQLRVQMKHYEIQRHNDSAKIDQLFNLVHSLSDTVASMAASQTRFQNEVARVTHRERRGSQQQQQQQQPTASPSRELAAQLTPEQIELREISQLLEHGRYEEASMKWIQSSQQADLFDNLFVRYNPAFLTALNPLVTLSVGVAVSVSLHTYTAERLAWLEVVFGSANMMDPEYRHVAPQIMDTFRERLDSLYMAIAENNPQDPVLRKIPPLSRRARELRGH